MRLLAAGVLALSAVAGACSSEADQTVQPSPAPVQSDAVVVDGFPVGAYGVGLVDGMVAFGAYAEFHEDGSGRLRGLVGNSSATLSPHDSGFTYSIDGDQVEVTATTGDCEAGETGTYRWSVEGSALRLTDPMDLCGDRRFALHGDWYPLGDTPVVEIDPGGDPVTIDSPIGPIDWHVVAGQTYGWARPDPGMADFQRSHLQVVAIDGGFVAVVVPDRALVFSANGIDWQPVPLPPSTLGLIAADGEKLYVAPTTAPVAVHVTADRGETWTALEVEDPPGSIDGLRAGPAGVMLTDSDRLMWLLDDDSFEKVPTTPAPFVEVLVLDTGFFALAVEENARKSYWRSADGRTWTEATDVPTDIHDRETTNWGDNIYLSNSEGIGYTSTDGGRTWGAPTMRPGEGLTVTDAGFFSVQPAVFGPGVGVVWVSSDDVDWQRVVNPWPPLWTFDPVISGDMILIPSQIGPPSSEPAHLDWVGYIN